MDIFKQKKLLIRLVLILAILNISILAAMLWRDFNHRGHRPPHPGKEGFREVSFIIEKELNLNTDQVSQFNNLRTSFFKKENALHELIRKQHDSMNEQIFKKESDEILAKAIALRVSNNEYQIELLRIEQAAELKKICTPEQQEKFESLVYEIRDYFRPDNKPNRPR